MIVYYIATCVHGCAWQLLIEKSDDDDGGGGDGTINVKPLQSTSHIKISQSATFWVKLGRKRGIKI